MTVQYIGAAAVGEALGVSRHAVHKWRTRYPAGSSHPFPEPDIEIDGTPGWRPNRVAEIARWRDGLPGRGAGEFPEMTEAEVCAWMIGKWRD